MISSFTGEYRWLSNFWPAETEFEGVVYPTSEHAYVAAKTLDPQSRLEISKISTATRVKRMGRMIVLRPNWDEIKLDVMRQIVRSKFTSDSKLIAMLVATGNEELVEGNYWGDTYWGVCRGQGSNHLGILLMHLRSELQGLTSGTE